MVICIRGVFKTYREFGISAGYVFDFRFFCGVMLVLMFVISADKYGHFECSVNFWHLLTCTSFGSSSIFAYSKKFIKESVSNFVWKTKLSARTYTECWLWHMVKLTWTQATFIGGTKCIPRAEKMWTTKSVPDARARNNRRKHSWSEENSI